MGGIILFLASCSSSEIPGSFTFTKGSFSTEKAVVTSFYSGEQHLTDENIYIGYQKDVPINKHLIVALLVGEKWCSEKGCKLTSLKFHNGKWIEHFSTVSDGGVWKSEVERGDKTGKAFMWCVSDNEGSQTIGWKQGKMRQLGYQKNNERGEKNIVCGERLPEIEKYR